MTKRGKKLAAIFLAVTMIITFVPVLGIMTAYAEDAITDLGNITVDISSQTRQVYKDDTYKTGHRIFLALYSAAQKGLVSGEKVGDMSYRLDLDSDGIMDVAYREIQNFEIGSSVVIEAMEGSKVHGDKKITLTQEAVTEAVYQSEAYSSVTIRFPVPEITIIRQPTDQYILLGETVTFSVEATGDDLEYQWEYTKNNGGTWIRTGSPTSSLEFKAKEDQGGDKYRCVITDSHGKTVKTDEALLVVLIDGGSKTLDLSKGPVWMPAADLYEYMRFAAYIFAWGGENPSYIYTEGFGPDVIQLDFDKNGTWDLRVEISEKNGEHGLLYKRAEDCSVEGTVPLAVKDMRSAAIALDITTYYSDLSFKMSDVSVTLNRKSYTYDGKAKKPSVTVKATSSESSKTLKEGTDYTVAYANGRINAGKYDVTVTLNNGQKYKQTFTINKAANPLKIRPKTATVKYSKLKKKAQTLAITKVITFTKKLNDKKTYTLVSAKKGSKSFKKYFKISKTTGKVTVKKNSEMKKGTYKVMVKVKAAGNANYKPSAVKTVIFKIKVK